MKSPLMKSVSGIRGIVGESFTPVLLNSAGSAFAKFAGYGTVVCRRQRQPAHWRSSFDEPDFGTSSLRM